MKIHPALAHFFGKSVEHASHLGGFFFVPGVQMQPPAIHFFAFEYLHTGVTVGATVGGVVGAVVGSPVGSVVGG